MALASVGSSSVNPDRPRRPRMDRLRANRSDGGGSPRPVAGGDSGSSRPARVVRGALRGWGERGERGEPVAGGGGGPHAPPARLGGWPQPSGRVRSGRPGG